jgi:quinol monooxygenase YgiN
MIEINKESVVQTSHYKPFDDSKDELLQELYNLLTPIHKEPLCLNFEIFIQKDGTLTTIGRWKNPLGFNLHQNMQYIEALIKKKLPVYCKHYESFEQRIIIPPITALSLLNE